MRNPRPTILTITLLLFSFAVCWSQTDKELKSKIVIVRSPDTDKTCTKDDQGQAVSVGNENVSIQTGDRFQIITHSKGIMNAKIIDKCKPSTYFEDGLFLFKAKDYVGWQGEYDALLAIKGDKIQADQVGSVAGIRLNELYRATVFDAVKGRLPATDTIHVEYATLLSPPNSTRLFLFVPTDHYNRMYNSVSDDAIITEGLLFEKRESELSLLISETRLLAVYSISDVDNDGVWEVLVHSADSGGGIYELRFFDGTRFKKEQLHLYEWSH